MPTERYSEIRTFAELSRKIGLPAKDLGFPILKKSEKFAKVKSKGGAFYVINDREGLKADMCDSPVTMAYKAGISIERFVEFNDMKETDLLTIGQVYYIQQKLGKASVPFHVVREGETLWDISQMYGVRLSNLLDFNRFDSVQRLLRGRVIWLQATRPKNKPIEYIEMPEELAEVENMMVAVPTKNVEKTYLKQDTIKTSEVKSLPKDSDLSALQPSQEIDKEQPKLVNLNDLATTKKELPNEVNLTTLPLNQEISKGNQQSIELKDKEVVSVKTELPKEIELNSSPLVQAIKEEQSNILSVPKSVDSQLVSEKDVKDEPQIITINSKNSPRNRLYPEEVGEGEENKNFLEHTVEKGETLFRISVYFNVAVAELWAWNNLTSTIVKEGTVLKIKR